MAACYPSNRDPCGQPPIIVSSLHLEIPGSDAFDYGMVPAKAYIVGNHDLQAVEILYEDAVTGEAWRVTLNPLAAVDFALKIARVAGELDAEQGDPT
jgi:hypothetical protein